MKPSPELYDLIHSLTKSEKRFFKLHSALQSGEKNYLRLFDAIHAQSGGYDEAALKKQFAKETFIQHLPSEKNHLYKLILKALRSYHAESSVSGQLKQQVSNIEILYNKSLYEEASKVLVRAKRVAKENERYYLWFELLTWEKMLLEEAYQSGNFSNDVGELIAEEDIVLGKLRNLAAYHVLYAKINYVFRSGGYVRTPEEHAIVEEISDHPLIKGKNTALSDRAASICLYTQGFCFWARRDWDTSYAKFKRAKEILDNRPVLRKDLPKRYVRTCYYIVQCEIELGKYDSARANIKHLRSLTGDPGFSDVDIKQQVFNSSWSAELRLLDRMGDYKAAIALEKPIVQHMGRMQREYDLEFRFLLSTAHFGAGDLSRSLHWLNRLLNDPEPTLRQDLYTYAKLFNLVVHYEMGNNELVEYISRSTKRFLTKRSRAYGVEAALVEHVRKLAKTSGAEAKHGLFVSLEAKLNELMEDPDESTVLKYFNICAWVRSKVQGITMAEAVRKEVAALKKTN
ncbi:MAG: hypothetical protein LKM36_13065 [Flavobacteriales bacterium]|jgi:tetratricopeptide (TPR) repeat protein|nr:hypothetical protein [Flavobacteriales bacterium]MBP9160929.1 hypothetical protein [Flavobacteriales bacterium]MCI1753748.1 hypothetical protein [Flavobacteriales bacterium]